MNPVRVDSTPPPVPPWILPVRPTLPPPLPPRRCPVCNVCPGDDWLVVFQDLVTRQQERIRKANERYQFAEVILFPTEQAQAKRYLADLQAGLDNFARLVREQNKYIDFGSGKVTPIVGPHGKADAIIAFITSTDRAVADFERFLGSISTPEAVRAKCQKLPAGQCTTPCKAEKRRVFADRCTF